MKIIHAADIHLGSKIESKFPKEISEERKLSIRNSFNHLIDYAKRNNIKIIMLSGDIFDSDKPSMKDKKFFYNVVKNNPEIDFLYLKGNHDISSVHDEVYDNLKLFDKNWVSYKYDNVIISGIEINKDNALSMYSSLSLSKNEVNIVMLHGQINDEINLIKLKDKNIDYLALGHIHKYDSGKIDDRGMYAYSGCLEPRGFDEIGPKGFIELEIKDNKVLHKFIDFSSKKINILDVDITSLNEAYLINKKVREDIDFVSKDIYRINLIGEVDYDVEDLQIDVKEYLSDTCYFVDVKDKTTRKIDIHKYDHDLSIKGEFVRTVWNNKEYSEQEKIQIITLGLKHLEGKE